MKDIELREESEKDSLIEELASSGNFRTTHRIIEDLSKYTDWSLRQVQDICRAVIDNNQVNWILGDKDVYDFLENLLDMEIVKKSKDTIFSEVRAEMTCAVEENDTEEDTNTAWWP